LIIDAMLGTGASGEPKAAAERLIAWRINRSARRVALDTQLAGTQRMRAKEHTFKADTTLNFRSA